MVHRSEQSAARCKLSGHERKFSDVCCAQFGLGRGARREDAADDLLLNEVIWRLIRAAHSPMPAPVHAAFVFAHETDDDDWVAHWKLDTCDQVPGAVKRKWKSSWRGLTRFSRRSCIALRQYDTRGIIL